MKPVTRRQRLQQRLKRHTYFILGSTALLLSLWVAGYCFMASPNQIAWATTLVTANTTYLLLWRLTLYGILLVGWNPLIVKLEALHGLAKDISRIPTILTYRRKLIIAILVFELLIAQNLFGTLLRWGLGVIYGR